MSGRINAYPFGGSPEVTVTVRVEDDPAVFAAESDGVQTHVDLLGRLVIDLRSLDVPESQVGAIILRLLADTIEGGER